MMRFKKLSVNYMYLGTVLLMLASMTVEGNYLLLFTFGWFASPDQRTPECQRPIQFFRTTNTVKVTLLVVFIISYIKESVEY